MKLIFITVIEGTDRWMNVYKYGSREQNLCGNLIGVAYDYGLTMALTATFTARKNSTFLFLWRD